MFYAIDFESRPLDGNNSELCLQLSGLIRGNVFVINKQTNMKSAVQPLVTTGNTNGIEMRSHFLIWYLFKR